MDNGNLHSRENGKEKTTYIAKLIAGYIGGTINSAEFSELEHWLGENEFNKKLFRYFTQPSFLLQLKQACWN